MRAFTITTTLIVSALISSVASAHPGHGVPEEKVGVLHYLTSPQHFLPVVAGIVLVGVMLFRKLRASRLTPSTPKS